jgi:hypothetical protein
MPCGVGTGGEKPPVTRFFFQLAVLIHFLCPQERQTFKTLKPADGQHVLNKTTIRNNEKRLKSKV